MDSQSAIVHTAALIALVQSLAKAELEDARRGDEIGPEVLAENRFLAARDGVQARLIDPAEGSLVPARTLIRELLERCRPHADELGCRH